MQISVVWIDREHAKLFHLSEDKMERDEIQATRVDHHTHRIEGDELDSPQMYHAVASKLGGKKRVLLIGPGIAKTHFLNFLKDRYPQIAQLIVGCETVDHPTNAQIAALALKYFNQPLRKLA